MDTQEIIARALCRAEGDDPDLPCFDVKGPDGPLWSHRTFDAREAMRALNEAGYVIVPKEPTAEMVNQGYTQIFECDAALSDTRDEAAMIYRAMINAAPHGAGMGQ